MTRSCIVLLLLAPACFSEPPRLVPSSEQDTEGGEVSSGDARTNLSTDGTSGGMGAPGSSVGGSSSSAPTEVGSSGSDASTSGGLATAGESSDDSEESGSSGGEQEGCGETGEDTCPAGCVGGAFAGETYLFCEETLDWEDARKACVELSAGDLLVIDDAAENAYVAERLATLFGAGKHWIGGHDSNDEGDWVWLDELEPFWIGDGGGEPFSGAFSNWSAFDPDNYPNADCAVMLTPYDQWGDESCLSERPYVCEVP